MSVSPTQAEPQHSENTRGDTRNAHVAPLVSIGPTQASGNNTLVDAPELGPWLDQPPEGLSPDLAAALRLAQHHAGDHPLLVPHGWGEAANQLLKRAESLPRDGIALERLPKDLLKALYKQREILLSQEDWSGRPAQDATRAAHLVATEGLLVRLYLALATLLGADKGLLAETTTRQQQRLVIAIGSWPLPELLATLEPPNHQYNAMKDALARYRHIAKVGGFVPIPDSLTKVDRHKIDALDLLKLRLRLAQEDPRLRKAEGSNELIDASLLEALHRSYRAHQLKPDRPKRKKRKKRKKRWPLIRKELAKALAVPIEARIDSLVLNLERIRQSDKRRFPYLVHVNLPDYHGEVWDGATRVHRFRVIIGNTKRRGGRWINATPTLSAYIYRVVYNPYWNVPKRIYEQELLHAANKWLSKQEDPALSTDDYFLDRGYDIKGSTRRPWVRKQPGPDNPLGKVKILFENRYFVYLHDTPGKRKFKRIRRAFSHGCMRVHEPLELARLLLSRDGSYERVEKRRVFAHYREVHLDLNTPVPIVADYITARVDEDGQVHWLHDVYNRDLTSLASR